MRRQSLNIETYRRSRYRPTSTSVTTPGLPLLWQQCIGFAPSLAFLTVSFPQHKKIKISSHRVIRASVESQNTNQTMLHHANSNLLLITIVDGNKKLKMITTDGVYEIYRSHSLILLSSLIFLSNHTKIKNAKAGRLSHMEQDLVIFPKTREHGLYMGSCSFKAWHVLNVWIIFDCKVNQNMFVCV